MYGSGDEEKEKTYVIEIYGHKLGILEVLSIFIVYFYIYSIISLVYYISELYVRP